MSEVPPAHSPIVQAKGIAVFLCGCRGAVSERLGMEALLQRALSHPSVRSVDPMAECCGPEDMDRMELTLRSGEVDRLLIAGCSYRLLSERMFQVARDGGLDPYMVEICNLKEQCASVHGRDDASKKALRLLDISLARCAMLQVPPHKEGGPISRTIMVLGGGHSACVAVREAYVQGHEVFMVNPKEKAVDEAHGEEVISLEEGSFEQFLSQVDDRVTLLNDTQILDLKGSPGDLRAVLDTPLGETEIAVGAVVLAIDEEEIPNPLKDRYHGRTITQHGLEEALREGGPIPQNVVMLAMDEEGESAFDPLSTHEAVHNALFLRTTRPGSRVTVVTREVFAFGQCEAGYRKAMESGVRILRTDGLPLEDEGSLTVHDVHLGAKITIACELLVLDDRTAVRGTATYAKALGVPIGGDGRFVRANAKLKPSSTVREGVFLCGTAAERSLGAGPSLEARAAVVKASTMLRGEVRSGGEVAEVWPERCSACLTCVRICPYQASSIGTEGKAIIDITRCQGCGICVGMCPSKAIQQYSFRDDQIEGQLVTAMRGGGT
jgi:heterodisulfide reductase subunit A-like polyferredoxin